MVKKRKIKIMLAKFGLDGHDNGIKIVARWLRDADFEVIYMGLYNTAEGIIKAAAERGVDFIGASFLEGEHMFYVLRLLDLAREKGLGNIKFLVGGVIPTDDILKLKELGVQAVYTPRTPKQDILSDLERLLRI